MHTNCCFGPGNRRFTAPLIIVFLALRKQRHEVKYLISGVGAPAEKNRVLAARLNEPDAGTLKIPEDTAAQE